MKIVKYINNWFKLKKNVLFYFLIHYMFIYYCIITFSQLNTNYVLFDDYLKIIFLTFEILQSNIV